MRRKTKILLFSLLASLMLNAVLAWAYVHYVVQVNNVFTIGAEYKCTVKVSEWNTQEKLDEFGVAAGQLLGRGIGANLYWGEMIGGSKWSPTINITNTSPDKDENITWIAVNLPSGMRLEAKFVVEGVPTGDQWYQGAAGIKMLAIGESFNVAFDMMPVGSVPDGTYSFDIDIRVED
jgi:hypothetical protein